MSPHPLRASPHPLNSHLLPGDADFAARWRLIESGVTKRLVQNAGALRCANAPYELPDALDSVCPVSLAVLNQAR